MGGIVAVYGSVGDGVYGEDVGGRGGGGTGAGMGGEQRDIWGEGKERKRRFSSFFFYRQICGCGGAMGENVIVFR